MLNDAKKPQALFFEESFSVGVTAKGVKSQDLHHLGGQNPLK